MQLYVPGFIWKMKTQSAYEGNQLNVDHIIFKRVFWTFKLCIDDFKLCKPVVQVDGTFLYGKYRGHYRLQLRKMTAITYYQLSLPM